MKIKDKYWVFLIIAVSFIAYLPLFSNNFTYYSDDNYVINNNIIKHLSLHNIKFIFSSFFDGHYHPLTMISLGISYKMGGLETPAYLVTNLVLHLTNTVLVFYLIKGMFKNIDLAVITSALFGLHTIHVESVARITERKDVLFTLFFLIALIYYIRYISSLKNKHLIWCFVFFFLSLLSKGQAVSFAVTIIAVDYYYKRNLISRRVILEKIPFILFAVLFGILNIYAQRYTGYFLDYSKMPFYEPFVDATYVLTNYIFKLLLPIKLSALYPYPNPLGSAVPLYMWLYLITPVLLLTLLLYFRKRSRIVVFGILFYIINVLLMLRIIPVAENVMPDRYNYIPSIGFFLLVGVGYIHFTTMFNKFKSRATIFIMIYALLLSVLTYQRCLAWKDGYSIWKDASSKYPESSIIKLNLADNESRKKDYISAMADLNQAILLDSNNILAYISLSNIKKAAGDMAGATEIYKKIISLHPGSADDLVNIASIKVLTGDIDGSLRDMDSAIQINPYNAKYYFNRGNLYSMNKNYTTAAADYDKTISMKPYFIASVYLFRAKALTMLEKFNEAIADCKEGLLYEPGNKELRNTKSQVIFIKENFNRNDNFNDPSKYNEKGVTLFNKEAYPFAMFYFDKALALDSNYTHAYHNKAIISYKTRMYQDAWENIQKEKKLGGKIDTTIWNSLSKMQLK